MSLDFNIVGWKEINYLAHPNFTVHIFAVRLHSFYLYWNATVSPCHYVEERASTVH